MEAPETRRRTGENRPKGSRGAIRKQTIRARMKTDTIRDAIRASRKKSNLLIASPTKQNPPNSEQNGRTSKDHKQVRDGKIQVPKKGPKTPEESLKRPGELRYIHHKNLRKNIERNKRTQNTARQPIVKAIQKGEQDPGPISIPVLSHITKEKKRNKIKILLR